MTSKEICEILEKCVKIKKAVLLAETDNTNKTQRTYNKGAIDAYNDTIEIINTTIIMIEENIIK